jgi:hypothetical protein
MLNHRGSFTAMFCHQPLQLLWLASRDHRLRLLGLLASLAALRCYSGHDARQAIGPLNVRLSGYPSRCFRVHGCAYLRHHGLDMLHQLDPIYSLRIQRRQYLHTTACSTSTPNGLRLTVLGDRSCGRRIHAQNHNDLANLEKSCRCKSQHRTLTNHHSLCYRISLDGQPLSFLS